MSSPAPLHREYLKSSGRLLIPPAVGFLLAFSLAPPALTLWFSRTDYRLLFPERTGFVGVANYARLLASPDFASALLSMVVLVAVVLVTGIIGGLALAVLLDQAAIANARPLDR